MRLLLTLCTLFACLLSISAADTQSYDWTQLDTAIGTPSSVHDNIATFTLPRTDLNVTVEGMDVPSAAGVASVFNFFQCPCGKIRVVGQFCCTDYEANDVIDAIRTGDAIRIAGMAPMFVGDKPHLLLINFQGEGDGLALAKLLHNALHWIGPARSATQPIK
jgi:Domain of Unknown Function (DUF1259)